VTGFLAEGGRLYLLAAGSFAAIGLGLLVWAECDRALRRWAWRRRARRKQGYVDLTRRA
jgi:peptidoglycan/LPS O-acetylase OafA/YrhL